MKKSVFGIILLIAITSFQIASAQDTLAGKPVNNLLMHYYSLKDALVAGKTEQAVTAVKEFIMTANMIDYKIISEGNINALLKDASLMAESKDIKYLRERFANLSSNMAMVAKAVKLSTSPVYIQYCPMKKATWLSAEKPIRNPYYGNAMLTCGQVVDTIGQ